MADGVRPRFIRAIKWVAVIALVVLFAYGAVEYKRRGREFLTDLAVTVDLTPYIFPSPSSYDRIPVYDIIVTRNDLQKLDTLVAKQKTRRQETYYKIRDFFRPFDPGERITVPAFLLFGNDRYKVRLGIRGDGSNHWKDRKRSYRVRFVEEPFQGIYELNLIIPVDRGIIAEEWSLRMARLMGVLAPESKFAALRMNGEDFGLYWQVQQLGPWFLEKRLRPRRSPIYKGEFDRKYWFTEYGNPRVFNNLGGWGIHKQKKFPNDYTPIYYMIKRLGEIEEGRKKLESIFEMVDKESLLRWIAHAYVCGSNHYDEYHNNKFYFNNSKGKLEPIAWDTHLLEYFNEKLMNSNRLIAAVLKRPEYRFERNRRAYEFLEKHQKTMVETYDAIKEEVLFPYLGDTKKVISNLNVLWRLRVYRNQFLGPNIVKLKDNLAKCRLTSTVFVQRGLLDIEAGVDGFSSVALNSASVLFLRRDGAPPKKLDAAFVLTGPDGYKRAAWRGSAVPEKEPGDKRLVRYRFPLGGRILYAAAARDGSLLAPSYRLEVSLSPGGMEFSNMEINATNAVSRGPCDSIVRVVFPDKSWDADISRVERGEFLKSHDIFGPGRAGHEIVLKPGVHDVARDLIVPANLTLRVPSRSHLRMARDASIVSYGRVEVAKSGGLVLSPKDGERWGVFGLMGDGAAGSVLRNLTVVRGGEATVRGVYFIGALSVHDSREITLESSTFEECRGDDGVNFQYVEGGAIRRCTFKGCIDAMDIDYSRGIVIENNSVSDSLNDGIDLGNSEAVVQNNVIRSSGDKGLSIGEGSEAKVSSNTIEAAVLGIAVKDEARATLEGNRLAGNIIAITTYAKKGVWGPPVMKEAGNILINNGMERFLDKRLSDVEEKAAALKRAKMQ